MLTIDQATYDAIVAHAKRDHPDEACGIVAGPEGSDRAERLVEMVNAAGSPTFYEFDSTELLALYKEMWANDEEPVVVYHSHTATEAYPSRTDIGLASEPGAHYVLVSTREHGNNEGPVEFRSYRIVDGEVTEEEVTVVDASSPSTPQTEESTAWPSRSGSPPSCAPTPAARRPSTADGASLSGADRRPRGQPPRHQGPAGRGTAATCAASSTSTSTTRTSASSAASRPPVSRRRPGRRAARRRRRLTGRRSRP